MDGDTTWTLSSTTNPSAHIQIDDMTLHNMLLKLRFRDGRMQMIADQQHFIETYDAPSAWYQLFPGEKHPLHPGDIFKMGNLTFAVERFNAQVVADRGNRPAMEDTYVCV